MTPGDKADKRITLEKIRLAVEVRVDGVLLNAKAEARLIGEVPEAMVFAVRGYLYGRRKIVANFQRPADWLEAVKERWMPKRLRRVFPVRYTRETVEVAQVFPELRLPGAGDGVTIPLPPTRTDWWDRGQPR